MIYKGYFETNKIYGTELNTKIEVETEDNAAFLVIDLTVTFNNIIWSHSFYIPFFQNSAEFYIDKFIHSLISQNFEKPNLNIEDYAFIDFSLAEIEMVLTEKTGNTSLNTLTRSFYMSLGKTDSLDYASINTTPVIIPVANTAYITENAVLTFSYYSNTHPTHIIVNEEEITLPTTTTITKIHSVTIPFKKLKKQEVSLYSLSLKFTNESLLDIGNYYLLEETLEHNLFAFQNSFGTISTIEFLGFIKTQETIKPNNFETSIDNVSQLFTTDLTESFPFEVTTGYLKDLSKYNMVRSFIRSFHIYWVSSSLMKIIINGSQRLTPYQSGVHQNNEKLKLKLTNNDSILHRIS